METKFNLNDKVKIIGSGLGYGLGCLIGTCGLVVSVQEVRRKIGYRVKIHSDRPSTFFWEDELESVVPEPKFKKGDVLVQYGQSDVLVYKGPSETAEFLVATDSKMHDYHVHVSSVCPIKGHQHEETILAYMKGAKIEFSHDGKTWCTIDAPMWNHDVHYRVKKKTVYKVAFHSKFAGEVLISIGYYESLEQFIKENAFFTDAILLPWTAKEE